MTLLPLPSYSSELNPMENVWQYLRANKLCARVWDGYEAIIAACGFPPAGLLRNGLFDDHAPNVSA